MGDIVLSPIRQQNFAGGSSHCSPNNVDAGKIAPISLGNVNNEEDGFEHPGESEEDLQEQITGNIG